MKLIFSPRARQDLTEIGRYIRVRNPVAALAVRDAIRASITNLATYPHAGRAVDKDGLHRLVVPRLPYVVFYQVDEPTRSVRIVTVRHTARQEEGQSDGP